MNDHDVLAVVDEWASAHGGISTFNRHLCCAWARAGADVCCLVLTASQAERHDAQRHGVILVESAATVRTSGLLALARKPVLPAGFDPSVIIGHARVTGPTARSLAEDHYPAAKRLQFAHMAPDDDEWHRLDLREETAGLAEARTELEVDLGRTAHLLVAVGPRLYNRYLNDLSAFPGARVLRLDPGFDADTSDRRQPPPGEPWKVLLLGRVANVSRKGVDLGAAAVGLAVRRRNIAASTVELVVRGATGEAAGLRDRLRAWADLPSLNVVVRPYSAVFGRLTADLHRASLVITPSRSEGFGLAGLEAIVAGTPVLVSGASGLGELLREVLPGADDVQRFVVPMSGDNREDAERWARAIEAVLRDREAAFARAAQLRDYLAARLTWSMAVEKLSAALDSQTEASAKPGSP